MVEAVGPEGGVFTNSALRRCQGLPNFAIAGATKVTKLVLKSFPISWKGGKNLVEQENKNFTKTVMRANSFQTQCFAPDQLRFMFTEAYGSKF